jgi:Domain of Unknown Function with PDB structure (DUF3857)/Protein of unknown function (DUF2569)/Transglutaminase-like superfamily
MLRASTLSIILINCFALMLFGLENSYAGIPEVHFSSKPAWLGVYSDYNKKPPLRTIESGYFYALIERQIHVEKQAEYRRYIREIVSSTGIQDGSQVSVSFDPTYERLDFHEIVVWRDNKPQDRLKLSDFKILADEQDFSKFIYQGSYSANFIIRDIRKGDRIEYAYTITGRNPIFNNKFFKDIYLQGSQPIAHQYIALVSSAARKLNMKAFNTGIKPVITEINGLKRYIWEDFLVKPVVENDHQPAWFNQYQHVQISEYDSWAEEVNWDLKINPPEVNIKGSLALLIAKLKVKYGNDKGAYFRDAVKIVQDEVRYMGIEIGEYSHRANRPEKVYDQRYGDCKDKSLLLVSMLKADGIEAEMALVNSSGNKIEQYMPTPGVFDHAVVVATINGQQVWVDATISNQRGDGTAIYFPNYGQALILKPGNSNLSVIPPSKTGKIVCEEKYTVKKDENAKVRLDVKTIYTLNQADNERANLADASMAETEKGYLDYYSKMYSKIEAKDSVQIIDDEHKNQLTTIESYLISDFYKRDSLSGRASVDFYANYISEQLPSISNQIKTPIAVNFPYAMDYTIKVVLSNGWDVTNSGDSIKRDAYQFISNYSTRADTLSLHYRFAYLKNYIPVDKAEEFKKDIEKLKNGELSYNIGHSIGNPPFALNIWLMILVLLILVTMIFVGKRIYRTETPPIVFAPGASFITIGGWLVLILIGLIITPISVMILLVNKDYFAISKWNTLTHSSSAIWFKSAVIYETTGNTILMGYAVFCLILLLNKRDILPKFISGYFIFAAIFFIIDYVFAINIKEADSSVLSAMIRSIIIAAIWVPYFRMSTRVEQTFIVPYPADNFSYEDQH